jgi:hypothetical protein
VVHISETEILVTYTYATGKSTDAIWKKIWEKLKEREKTMHENDTQALEVNTSFTL